MTSARVGVARNINTVAASEEHAKIHSGCVVL